MNESPIEYNYEAMRVLIRESFTDQDLRRFCQDHRRFRPILSHFGGKFSLEDMIDVLIEWCQKRALVPELLIEIEAANPGQFARYQESLIAETPPSALASPESLPATSPGIPDRFRASLRHHGRIVSLVLVLALVIIVVMLAVVGVPSYLQQRRTPQYWIERFLGIESADVRIVALARLVDLTVTEEDAKRWFYRVPLTNFVSLTDGEEDAQNLFFEELTAADQVAMFSVSDPEGLVQDLIVVIKLLYVKLDNTGQGNSILEAMAEALPERSRLPAGVATKLSLELEQWQRGRRFQSEGEYLSAVDYYTLAIGQNEENPGTRVDLASAYAALERYPDALTELGRALELDPSQRSAIEQVVDHNAGLFTHLGLHRPRYRAIADFFPTLTPTPTPTYTPTSTNTPTSTPARTLTSTPTPRPTDDQAVRFEDDFDSGTTPGRLELGEWQGWTLRESGQADWHVRERVPGNHVLCVNGSDGYAVYPSTWQDYALELDIQIVDFSDGGEGNIQVRDQDVAYELRIEEEEISLWRQDGNFLARATTVLTPKEWHTVRFEARGAHLEVFLDSASILKAQDEFLTEGGIRLGARGGGEVCFDNVRVTSTSERH